MPQQGPLSAFTDVYSQRRGRGAGQPPPPPPPPVAQGAWGFNGPLDYRYGDGGQQQGGGADAQAGGRTAGRREPDFGGMSLSEVLASSKKRDPPFPRKKPVQEGGEA